MKSKTTDTTNNRQIIAEATEWFVIFRFDDANAQARERFAQWLRRSPEHIQAYLQITEVWAALPRGDPGGSIDVAPLVARARMPDADVVPLNPSMAVPCKSFRAARRGWMTAAVAIGCLISLTTGWLLLVDRETYSTAAGEHRSLTLEDGSTVDLNALTRIRVHFSRTAREVELITGQALFNVAHDRARPFRVHSGTETLTAVGTEFDVYRKRDSTVVTVVEGRVALTTDSQAADQRQTGPTTTNVRPREAGNIPLFLAAGDQVVVTPRTPAKPRRADLERATAWVRNKLIFDFTPLSEMAEEFNRYNTRPLIIVDPDLMGLQISGVYSSNDPTSLLRFLREQPQIQVTESDQGIRITKKPH